MTHRALFIEADDRKPYPACYRSHNVAPLVVFNFTEGTPYHADGSANPTNAGKARALRDLPAGLRGVRANWFGDSRLPAGHNRRLCAEWADLIREHTDGQGVQVCFLNNEEFPREQAKYDELNSDIAPVVALSRATGNWNDCIGGSGWWGPYSGKVIGTHSIPMAYDAGPLTALWRWQRTIRACLPNVVVHLPVVGRQTDDMRLEQADDATLYKRTESVIRYATRRGVRHFVVAPYMLPDAWVAPYISFVSWCLADCDRLWPLEDSAQ